MEHLAYSLFLSLLHSFWQAGMLLCVYMFLTLFLNKSNPVHKRNLLFFLLVAQLFITISTFFIYYSGSAIFYSAYISSGLSELLTRQPYMEVIAPLIVSAYIVALIYKSAKLLFNWQRFRKNVRSSWIKPSVDFKLFTIVKANEFGIRRKVMLWYSNAINTPLTFGFLKPVILLPVALINNLSVEETETLIIHELTHIKNNDYFFNWMLIVCETVFFFNPFTRIIAGKIKLEREKNCDTQVLQFNYSALAYAETLLKTARFKTTPTPFFLAAVFKNAQLIRRIKFFTEEKNLNFKKTNYSRLSILPVAAMLVLNIFLINFIKNRNASNETASTTSAAVAGAGNEKIWNHFSTDVLPVSEDDNKQPSTTDEANDAAVENNLSAKLSKLAAEKDALKLQVNEIAPIDIDLPMSEPMPVALIDNYDSSKEVVLTEENSATGRSVKKVYKISIENGEWKTRLMWTITERRSITDSLHHIIDSVNNRLYGQSQ